MRWSNPSVIELIGPVAMCFALVLVTTLLLSAIDRFTIVLAVIASKVIGVLAYDTSGDKVIE